MYLQKQQAILKMEAIISNPDDPEKKMQAIAECYNRNRLTLEQEHDPYNKKLLKGLLTFDLPTTKSIGLARISPNLRQIRLSILLKFDKILAEPLLFSLRQIKCQQTLTYVW